MNTTLFNEASPLCNFICFSILSSIAAINERILILAAPKLFTSSIFNEVYIFPAFVNIFFTSSVVTASKPQPKEFNCTYSRFCCVFTKAAASYNLE